MVTRTIVTYVCDLCETDDMVEEHELTIDGQTVLGDACFKCWQELQESLVIFWKVGRKPTPKKVSGKANVMPFPGEAWHFTSHALIRMGERHIDPSKAAEAAESPEVVRPGRDDHSEIRCRGKVQVVVDLKKRTILTAARRDEEVEHVA